MDIKQDILTRIGIIYILIFVFGLTVIGKIVHIQYFDEDMAARAEKAETKTNIIKPKRGDIYSRDGRVLACSVPEYVVYFDYRIPAFDKSDTLFRNNVDKLAEGLARIFVKEGKTKQAYLKELHETAKKDSYLRLHTKPIDYNTLQEVKALPILERGPYKGGLLIDTYNSRVYPFGDIAKRTIGLLPKKGYHGKTGLELYYDSYLYGREGEQTHNNGPTNNPNGNGTVDGYDIITTIDTEIQSIANEELERALKEYKGSWGCAIVMEVKTGEILAISNLKLKTVKGDTVFSEAFNYAIDKRCEPGSTIKLPSLMIALEDGVVSLDDVIDTKNGIIKFYPKQSIVDWNHKTQGGFGKLTVKEVFANSSNVGVTKIIYDNYDQPNKEREYIERLWSMGLNNISQVDLSKEPAPLIKDPSMNTETDDYKWYASDLVQMAYGYSIELTPLQILNFYNAVANNGVMIKPHLVKEIRNETDVIQSFKTEITNSNICSQSTLEKSKQMLEEVVLTGTGKKIKNKYYKIAGKTGTAQTYVDSTGGYDKLLLRGSFCGYFPAESPKYSMIIVMQSSKRYDPYRISGSSAAHTFKKISDRIYFTDHELRNQLSTDSSVVVEMPEVSNGYTDDFKTIYKELNIKHETPPSNYWTKNQATKNKITSEALITDKAIIPDFNGLGLRDALFLAENMNLRVESTGYGKVHRQSIPKGNALRKGETIVLELQ